MKFQPAPSATALKTIRDFAGKKLQYEYPYLKTDILNKILDKTMKSLQEDLLKAWVQPDVCLPFDDRVDVRSSGSQR